MERNKMAVDVSGHFEPVREIAADRLLARPGAAEAERRRRIVLEGDRIAAVAPAAEPLHDPSGLAGPGALVMPALGNGHDHGRGLRPLAYGVADGPVEAWVPATYTMPPVDPYLVAAVALARQARSGIGAVVHCHLSRPPEALLREAEAVARAAREVGVGVGFVVPLRDRNPLVYGDDARLLAGLDPAERQAVVARWKRKLAPIEAQLALVEEIAGRFEGPHFRVQYGPVAVEWCSTALLERIAAASARTGRRVHMHLLESKYQRQWYDQAFPEGVVRHLDRIGLLTPRLALAHGVWLRPDECALLAERGVAVSVNTSSNLRLRSGLAPVADMVAAGTPIAFGLDSGALDDDEDMLRELRLAHLLHRGWGFDDALTADLLFHGACAAAPRLATGAEDCGAVEPGRPADLLVLDFDAMAADMVDGLCSETEAVLGRATARHVKGLVVAGRAVVRAGGVVGLDLAGATAELTAQARAHAGDLRALRPELLAHQERLRAFYRRATW
jgi:cytosine/adenosine deaminase-related metal-dependent hydrolase